MKRKGDALSPEARAKMSEAMSKSWEERKRNGWTWGPEARAKMSKMAQAQVAKGRIARCTTAADTLSELLHIPVAQAYALILRVLEEDALDRYAKEMGFNEEAPER